MVSVKKHAICIVTVVLSAVAYSDTNLFLDMNFQKGFLLGYPTADMGRKVEAVLDYGDKGNKPVWRLCQWGTRFSLADAECLRDEAGNISYANRGKRVVAGKDDGRLLLDIHGKAEYGERVRKYGEAWPHLLIEQDAAQVFALGKLAAIRFGVKVRLTAFENHMNPKDYDPGLHGAQCQMFFIVKCINRQSKDYGDFIWFGVPFFDNRREIPGAYMAKDVGKDDATGKFIYTIDGREVNTTPLKSGKEVTIEKDLLPYIKAGLIEAVKRGYLSGSDPKDYAVVNMNLGWEIPGTFDAAVQIQNLSITAEPLVR
jgi:hypothetical protein